MTLDPKEYSAVIKVRGGKTYPDLVNSVALKNLPRETAQAEDWPTYYLPEPCQHGHVSSRFTKNTQCVDCWRCRQGREPIYPMAKNREYYKQREAAPAVAASGAPVIVAPPAPPEPSKKDQEFLAALDSTRDFDTAAKQVGSTRGLIEARASSNPTFRAALADLCTRRDIPWTRAADPKAFVWTDAIERQLVKRYIDTGLIEQARNELGIAASDYQQHLQDSADFVGLIDAARPAARETLRERAMHAAAIGNDRLAKLLEDEGHGLITLVGGQRVHPLGNPDAMRAELEDILRDARKRLDAQERLRAACAARLEAEAARKPAKPTDEETT